MIEFGRLNECPLGFGGLARVIDCYSIQNQPSTFDDYPVNVGPVCQFCGFP